MYAILPIRFLTFYFLRRTTMAIHEYDKQYKAAIASLDRCDLSDGNKKIVKEFVNDLILEGLSKPRIRKDVVGRWDRKERTGLTQLTLPRRYGTTSTTSHEVLMSHTVPIGKFIFFVGLIFFVLFLLFFVIRNMQKENTFSI
jgi:hypothetical protein